MSCSIWCSDEWRTYITGVYHRGPADNCEFFIIIIIIGPATGARINNIKRVRGRVTICRIKTRRPTQFCEKAKTTKGTRKCIECFLERRENNIISIE